jgi:hypothetical protein
MVSGHVSRDDMPTTDTLTTADSRRAKTVRADEDRQESREIDAAADQRSAA